MPVSNEQLFKLLSENKYLSEKKLQKATEVAKNNQTSLYEAIDSENLLTNENIGQVIADYLKIPYINLSKVSIDPQILNLIPETFAKNQGFIAFTKDGQGLKIATYNPDNQEGLSFLSKKIMQLEWVLLKVKQYLPRLLPCSFYPII